MAITFIASTRKYISSASSTTVTIPTCQASDLLLMQVFVGTGGAANTPAGWTLLNSVNPGGAKQYVYGKTAVVGDSGASVTVTFTAASFVDFGVSSWRGAANFGIASSTGSTYAYSATSPVVNPGSTGLAVSLFGEATTDAGTFTFTGQTAIHYNGKTTGYRLGCTSDPNGGVTASSSVATDFLASSVELLDITGPTVSVWNGSTEIAATAKWWDGSTEQPVTLEITA